MFYFQHLFNIILAIVIFFHTSYFAKRFIKMGPPCRFISGFFFFFFFLFAFHYDYILYHFYSFFLYLCKNTWTCSHFVALDFLKIFEILLSNLLHVKYFFFFFKYNAIWLFTILSTLSFKPMQKLFVSIWMSLKPFFTILLSNKW